MNDHLEEAKAIVNKMEEESNLSKVADMLKDNKIEFTHKEVLYRVRLLTVGEKDELDVSRKRKFGELLKDANILFAKEIIKLYKEKGIDIEKDIDEVISKLNSQEVDVQIQLGEAISKKEADSVLKAYEEKIYNIRIEKRILSTQKIRLLENCFENLLEGYIYKCLVYLSLEKKQDEEWVKVYNSLVEFNNEMDSDLVIKSGELSSILQAS
jgi:hypothetical protein